MRNSPVYLSYIDSAFAEPLYIVGAGDLGTTATKVDSSLSSILKISASWGAVVLIDEADVFLEERALHHIERNAMVAVFLRHLESAVPHVDFYILLT